MPHDPARARPARGVKLDRAVPIVVLVLAGLAVPTRHAAAAPPVQTFGPGQVNCQALTGTQEDCLLAASRVSQDNSNVVAFSVASLPRGEQALFRKWCVPTTDECTVTVTGRRAAPQSTRIATVTRLRWTRLSAPENQAAARALQASAPDTRGAGAPPAQQDTP